MIDDDDTHLHYDNNNNTPSDNYSLTNLSPSLHPPSYSTHSRT